MVEVTVVIPTLNRAHVLPRAIRSALAQTVTDLEVLVVDDGSTDGTQSVVEALSEPRVRLLRHERRRGAPAARNTGIEHARGEYLAFLDSDDEWLSMKLERQLTALSPSGDGAFDVATCGLTPRGVPERSPEARPPRELSYRGLLAFRDGPWGGQTILVRRTEATEAVRFDESLHSGQDWDYVVRLARRVRVVTVPEPLVLVHRAPGEFIGTPTAKLRGRLQLLAKYGEELRRRPDALAAHLAGIGKASIRCGQTRQAWSYLGRTLACGPTGLRHGARLFSFFVKRSGAAALDRVGAPKH